VALERWRLGRLSAQSLVAAGTARPGATRMVVKINEVARAAGEIVLDFSSSTVWITSTVIFFYTLRSIFDKTELEIFIYA
jgi:hypothetical protein